MFPLLCRKPVPTRLVAAQITRTTECIATSPPRPAESVSIGAATGVFVRSSALAMRPPNVHRDATARAKMMIRWLLGILVASHCAKSDLVNTADLHKAMDRALAAG